MSKDEWLPDNVAHGDIDEWFGTEDPGTEIDTEEGGVVNLYEDGDTIVFQVFDKAGKLETEFSLRAGSKWAMVKAIQERM